LTRLIPRPSSREARFEYHGLIPSAAQPHLESILDAFVVGFNAALDERDDGELARWLGANFRPHWLGFAFEGAGAARAAEDLLAPWPSRRLRTVLTGAGAEHDYIATVGAGLTLARLPWGLRCLDRYMATVDPLLAWCVADGVGFYHGLFKHRTTVARCAEPPARLSASTRQLFDAGLGRSLWWIGGASPERIGEAIARFPEARRPELWCGVGLASAYAGGVDAESLQRLLAQSGPYHADFRAGIPFACRLRQKARNPSALTDLAARLLLGCEADVAASYLAGLQDSTLEELGADEAAVRENGYREMRRRLTAALAAGEFPAPG
ncbi:MAG TPA: DUF1702 family protein, partial [Thermoanaerobaculia bacterium]|nr:DUF1702 family protein [Thermoanaerobaculia bacterium]